MEHKGHITLLVRKTESEFELYKGHLLGFIPFTKADNYIMIKVTLQINMNWKLYPHIVCQQYKQTYYSNLTLYLCLHVRSLRVCKIYSLYIYTLVHYKHFQQSICDRRCYDLCPHRFLQHAGPTQVLKILDLNFYVCVLDAEACSLLFRLPRLYPCELSS